MLGCKHVNCSKCQINCVTTWQNLQHNTQIIKVGVSDDS
jgi:hypothetical protein